MRAPRNYGDFMAEDFQDTVPQRVCDALETIRPVVTRENIMEALQQLIAGPAVQYEKLRRIMVDHELATTQQRNANEMGLMLATGATCRLVVGDRSIEINHDAAATLLHMAAEECSASARRLGGLLERFVNELP